MNKILLVTATLAIAFLLFFPINASATKMANYGERLTRYGYELTESGMRNALESDRLRDVYTAFNYIAQEEITNLVPDVKVALSELEKKKHLGQSSHIKAISCLLFIEKNMSIRDFNAYMTRIRHQLYEVKEGDKDFRGAPISAYVALLAAQKGKKVDIYDDLMYLGSSEIMRGKSEHSFVIEKLFKLYGEEVPDADIDTLLESWSDWPERQQDILRNARKYGKRLETATHETIPASTSER